MQTTSKTRHRDNGEWIGRLRDEILVQCPRCHSCARILPICRGEARPDMVDPFNPRRLTCNHCGLTKDWEERGMGHDPYADPVRDEYFHCSLWLQIPCCGRVLWAFNERHLLTLEDYIKAELREGFRDEMGNYRNSTWINRLPEWMIVAKHREPVLKAIAKMKREKLHHYMPAS